MELSKPRWSQPWGVSAEPSSAAVSRENLQIEVRGDLAWAYFDQNLTPSDDPMDPPVQSHNVRVLKRADDGWRIVFHGVWAPYVSGVTRPLIEVDAAAKVLWQNGPAHRALADFPV